MMPVPLPWNSLAEEPIKLFCCFMMDWDTLALCMLLLSLCASISEILSSPPVYFARFRRAELPLWAAAILPETGW